MVRGSMRRALRRFKWLKSSRAISTELIEPFRTRSIRSFSVSRIDSDWTGARSSKLTIMKWPYKYNKLLKLSSRSPGLKSRWHMNNSKKGSKHWRRRSKLKRTCAMSCVSNAKTTMIQ